MSNIQEGSKVLELLTEVDLLEDFYEAIDDDNISKVISILKKAQIDEDTIKEIVQEIQESNS